MNRPAARDLRLLGLAALLLLATAACRSDGSMERRDGPRELDWQMQTMRKHFDRDVRNSRDNFSDWGEKFSVHWDNSIQAMKDTSALYLGDRGEPSHLRTPERRVRKYKRGWTDPRGVSEE